MADEVETIQTAEVTAPEQEQTATPESETQTPETQETEEKPEKTFTQEELDAAIAKRLSRERRKWEREARAPEPRVSTEPVKPEQFDTWEDYAEALAEQKAELKLRERESQRHQSQVDSAYEDRVEEAKGRYDDFEQVAYNPNLRITPAMAETIKASESGPDVAYYLGLNPKEADRISQLHPLQQAKEIGKIEAKLAAEPPVKKSSSAPAPITPVKPGGGSQSFDTTDPRSIKSMSTSEWIEAERQRQIKKLKAQANL